jgi:hypothetical protein
VRGLRGGGRRGGVRRRPGAARTILLFHIISARPSKQARMVGSTLGVDSFGLTFVSARTNKRHHHRGLDTHIVAVCSQAPADPSMVVVFMDLHQAYWQILRPSIRLESLHQVRTLCPSKFARRQMYVSVAS